MPGSESPVKSVVGDRPGSDRRLSISLRPTGGTVRLLRVPKSIASCKPVQAASPDCPVVAAEPPNRNSLAVRRLEPEYGKTCLRTGSRNRQQTPFLDGH